MGREAQAVARDILPLWQKKPSPEVGQTPTRTLRGRGVCGVGDAQPSPGHSPEQPMLTGTAPSRAGTAHWHPPPILQLYDAINFTCEAIRATSSPTCWGRNQAVILRHMSCSAMRLRDESHPRTDRDLGSPREMVLPGGTVGISASQHKPCPAADHHQPQAPPRLCREVISPRIPPIQAIASLRQAETCLKCS